MRPKWAFFIIIPLVIQHYAYSELPCETYHLCVQVTDSGNTEVHSFTVETCHYLPY